MSRWRSTASAAFLYFVINYALSLGSRALERRFSYVRE